MYAQSALGTTQLQSTNLFINFTLGIQNNIFNRSAKFSQETNSSRRLKSVQLLSSIEMS